MDSDGSPRRQRAAHGGWKFRVPHVMALASTKIQGGKTNEQERKLHGGSSGCGKDGHP